MGCLPSPHPHGVSGMARENTQVHPRDAKYSAATTDEILFYLIRELGGEMQLRESALHHLSAQTSLDADLGLDSLTRVELLARIERRFNVRLAAETMAEVVTLGELRDAILGAESAAAEKPAREVSGLVLEATESSPLDCQTLTQVLEWHVRNHPERPHIELYSETTEGEVLTFRQLYEGAAAVATGLREAGLNPGDAVAIMLPTGKDYFFSFFGVLLAGAVPVSLYPPTRLSQLEDHLRRHKNILENCRATRLISFPEVRPFARLLKAQLPSLESVRTVEEIRRPTAMTVAFPQRAGGDVAFLQYTSGSTGNPKGVVLTHANLLANIRAMGERMQVHSKDVIVSWLPLYHDMGLIGCWLGSLYYACLFVVMSPMDFIAHPERWLWAIHRYRGSISAAPNFAYELCLKRIDEQQRQGLDLSSLRIACNGAEAVSPQTVRRFLEAFGRYGFREDALLPVYGLAENSVGLSFPPLGRPPLIDRIQRDLFSRTGKAEPADADDVTALEFVACGFPLTGNEMRVVDEVYQELPPRREGSLQFRSPSATRGYFRNPEENKKLFHGGWLNTGDRAYMADGDVYITGRSKDIIIHGGRNLYPEEMEQAIGEIAGVRKGCVAVFGSREPRSGTEKLVVLAETRIRDSARQQELRQAIDQVAVDVTGLPPDDVVLAPPHSVLKTSSGKVRRSATRAEYERGHVGPHGRSLGVQITRLLATAVLPQLRRIIRLTAAAGYALWFWGVVGLCAPLVWLSVVLTPTRKWRWTLMRAWGRLVTTLLGIPVRVGGRDHLPVPEKPLVLVGNHSSYLDVFVLITGLPRTVRFVTKVELSKPWLVRTLLDRVGVDYVARVDRQQSAEDAERLVERARQGESLFFFPEGTFTRVSGIYPFHMGAFLTAVQAGRDVLPVSIRGTRSILRSGSRWPRRGKVDITIDRPIPAGGGQVDPWEVAVRLRDRARQSILAHSGEPDLARERPPIW